MANGGSYHFGNSTCRKRWDELVREQMAMGKCERVPFYEQQGHLVPVLGSHGHGHGRGVAMALELRPGAGHGAQQQCVCQGRGQGQVGYHAGSYGQGM